MVNINQLEKMLDKLYTTKEYPYLAKPEGLLVEGRQKVHKICLIHEPEHYFVNKAVDAQADVIIAHRTVKKMELKGYLKDQGISLFVYYRSMDGHDKIGHNRYLLNLLDIKKAQRFGFVHNDTIGYSFKNSLPIDDVVEQLEIGLRKRVTYRCYGDNTEKIGVFSGSHRPGLVAQAIDAGVGTLIVGEYNEGNTLVNLMGRNRPTGAFPDPALDLEKARDDLRVNIIECGHRESEIGGLYLLKRHLNKKTDARVEIISS